MATKSHTILEITCDICGREIDLEELEKRPFCAAGGVYVDFALREYEGKKIADVCSSCHNQIADAINILKKTQEFINGD